MSTSVVQDGRPTPPSSRRRWIAVVVAVLLLVGLVAGYSLWWSRPTAFAIVGPSFIPTPGTVDATHPITSTVAELPLGAGDETVDVDHVRATLRENTAQARVTFHVCEFEGNGFLSSSGPATSSCTTVSPVEGHRVHLSRHTAIVMTVTPRRAGRADVVGVEIAYTRDGAHLWQHGTQASVVGLDVRVAR